MQSVAFEMPRRSAPIVLGIVLALAGTAAAVPHGLPVSRTRTVEKDEPAKEAGAKPPELSLADCLRIAFEKQPKLAASRASLAAAQAGQRGLERNRVFGQLTADYKYRVQQSCNGVLASAAELAQTEHDVTQAVVWTYFSVVYAREQVKVASDAVEFVEFYRAQVDKIVNDKKGGNNEINQLTLNELIIRLSEGKRLLIKAEAGVQKAMAGLREAIGVAHDYSFEIAEASLPDFKKFEIKKDAVIAHAQTRRGEVIMAGLLADVTKIEAHVQWAIRFRFQTETFASGADIHSRPIPSGSKEGEYRPDAIGPEMPAKLFGTRQDRYQKAWQLALRSEAVVEKTRNLVGLEAEVAFIDFEAAGKTLIEARNEFETANKQYTIVKGVAGERVNKAADLKNMLETYGMLARAQANVNEAVYQRIVALAAIERHTAGGIKINYPTR